MLVLTRKNGESIIIGKDENGNNDIEITILCIHDGRARIGITATKDIKVDRREIWEKKKIEQEA